MRKSSVTSRSSLPCGASACHFTSLGLASCPVPGRPKPGDAVYFAKYAGILVTCRDGREARMCKDKDIMGIIREKA